MGFDYIWYMDLYDKLKLYGLCINGCIDGFLRNIIWLECYWISSDLIIIVGYFINVIDVRKGCLKCIWGDRGIENGYVVVM